MRDYISEMLDLILNFEDEELVEELRTAIQQQFPANANASFDQGLDLLASLFNDLL